LSSSALPTLSSSQVKEVDALAEERFGIPLDWLMEAAGWQVARLVEGRAVVVCGVGNNAGDGFAAARHLQRWGRLVRTCCVDAAGLRGPAERQYRVLGNQGVEVSAGLVLDGADVVVDAIFGTGLSRPPEGTFALWIEAINASGLEVVSVDVPSGLDAETGVAYSPTVVAQLTIALGLPKPGLLQRPGRVVVADIGVPAEAYAAVGVKVPAGLFAHGDVVRL